MNERLDQKAGAATTSAGIDAVLFDMDGVITDTARAHAAAWKQLFDAWLVEHHPDEPPFDEDADYREYVDGKPRYDGVESFLASRGIELPHGSDDDEPGSATVCGLGNAKNRYFNAWLEEHRVEAYPGSLALLDRLQRAGLRLAVFSSSRNATAVLKSAGVLDCFEIKVDGEDMAAEGLPGKPDPAIMLQAAERLAVAPERTAVVEDATAGVRAGVAGGFAQTIGVDRGGAAADLRRAGADLVVADLAELVLDETGRLVARTLDATPSVWTATEALAERLAGQRPAVFLDYDGTLTPIVDDPAAAVLDAGMRRALGNLAARLPVAVVSGRDLDEVQGLIGDDTLHYAGSHGFDLAGPGGWHEVVERGRAFLPGLKAAADDLEDALGDLAGATVERKRFSLAVHYRRVAEGDVDAVREAVEAVMARHGRLKLSGGKKVFDIKPRTDWHKGRAVEALLERLGLDRADVVPLYLGDDTTDEDAFRALADRGIGVVVRGSDGDGDARWTSAEYALDGTGEVERFLDWLAARAPR